MKTYITNSFWLSWSEQEVAQVISLDCSFTFVTAVHVKSLNYLLRTGEEQTCIQLKKKNKTLLHYYKAFQRQYVVLEKNAE